jgi:hypothetical protein
MGLSLASTGVRSGVIYGREFGKNDKKIEIILLHTPWSRVLREKLTGSQLAKKFPSFYGTHKFVTTFTSSHHLTPILSQLDPLHAPTFNFLKIHHNTILPLCLGHPSGLFPSGFSTKSLYTPLLSPICATCLAHLMKVI